MWFQESSCPRLCTLYVLPHRLHTEKQLFTVTVNILSYTPDWAASNISMQHMARRRKKEHWSLKNFQAWNLLIVLIHTCALQYLASFQYFTHANIQRAFLSACRLTKLPAGKEVPKNSVCHYIFLLLKFLSTQIYMGQEKPKHFFYKSCLARHKWFYLFVPTLWFGAMSIVSVAESCLTANPRSAMQHVPFFFTNIFFDFKSLWAIAGLPVREKK